VLNKPTLNEAVTQVLDEIGENRTALKSRRVNVHNRVDLDINETSGAKQTWSLSADIQIDPIPTRIRVEQLDGTRPFVQLRIADVRNEVGLVERDPTAGFYQGDRLPDDFFRLRHIDQHPAARSRHRKLPAADRLHARHPR